ncbi:hypothetical protein HELRODRAFT_177672 [Helobdella robusta]|uniref:Glycosyltransferase family 92 protein n=1 Tax=Helobdella robusta TaxID=6412 RepID=T1FC19_HELRO|nr:hypothetical protein HELRODRAFT_177672 [Helobdella robusta]ESN97999.1 hypothetical protein HELRODRAFT_177672 [Helobdella robusta]
MKFCNIKNLTLRHKNRIARIFFLLLVFCILFNTFDDVYKRYINALKQNVNIIISKSYFSNDGFISPIIHLPIPKQDDIKYRNEFWQVHQKIHDVAYDNRSNSPLATPDLDEIVAYFSYHDDRRQVIQHTGSRWVRVLAVKKLNKHPTSVFCQMWFHGEDEQINGYGKVEERLLGTPTVRIVRARVHATGRDHNILNLRNKTSSAKLNVEDDHLRYGQFLFSCPIGSKIKITPKFVSLAFSKYEKSSIMLPVYDFPEDNASLDMENEKNNVDQIFMKDSHAYVVEDVEGDADYEEGIEKNSEASINKTAEDSNDGNFRYEFVVCVDGSYGKLNVKEFIEWMELNILLGVSHVTLHNVTWRADEQVQSVLQHYEERGLLKLYGISSAFENWQPIVYSNLSSRDIFEPISLGSPSALNHCYWRYTKLAKWVLVIDYDEIIIPQQVLTYQEMFKELLQKSKKSDKKKKWETPHTFVFSMAYHFRTWPKISKTGNSSYNIESNQTVENLLQSDDSNFSPHRYRLYTDRFHYRTNPLSSWTAPKSFSDPRRCLSVFNHYCYIHLPGDVGESFNVGNDVGMVHHYRTKCPRSDEDCEKFAPGKIYDSNIDRYFEVLKKNVKLVFDKILV